MKKKLFIILFFGCFGMAMEIFFVAIMALISSNTVCDQPLASMTGKTYVWMFPIYALIPILGGPLFSYMQKMPTWIRIPLYAIAILTVEFITGFILDKVTGKCPWEYTTGLHVMGYARIDYMPVWMLFSYAIEKLYLFVKNSIKE